MIKEKNIKEDVSEPSIYEVGYHLIPSIAEEDVPAEASVLKDSIESAGGAILSDENPKSVRLAYAVDHAVNNVKNIYDSAYFGWIKFFVTPSGVSKIKGFIEDNHKVFRFIIIKTVREDTLAKRPPLRMKKAGDEKKSVSGATPVENIPALSVEELDKTIEELVIE
ncbi:MAG: hypothetical protein COZ49_00265 [Candidatus Yonathbacteria bacterium CG_4_10_14_3_um_filter_47_65]|uniref:Small ribosomal subunit protein bS6 n=2 Tax=Parcubacteria group TaxID=1794811 RepID=A0A2M8D7F8_9BACT|nr:MAG: hypothetical protein AUJ44_01875 [Candidatus Nomurabacteria bacterium CG1_02_47_685]PIP04154.1 MAG: hypothetical protein COX54_00450 [Candidatus Yonathbacteria bacterium CG23_combo_of_CG06-09_8_20_14_all_46_18]PIQ31819.1 MAG: hypothetical protein COW61_02945 [Candidatus Yonathbacteria bacterium CG17_big_fil_post_rev_8_21_14_2_50_46_19]PIX56763.1 MAG: hypothetical protein COZ49_00265 [Candidatus Yonathbacteria bacterium CG_4_10_14_3_um_filter_47_65]PIY57597.1 MAG: hypothetical protein CO